MVFPPTLNQLLISIESDMLFLSSSFMRPLNAFLSLTLSINAISLCDPYLSFSQIPHVGLFKSWMCRDLPGSPGGWDSAPQTQGPGAQHWSGAGSRSLPAAAERSLTAAQAPHSQVNKCVYAGLPGCQLWQGTRLPARETQETQVWSLGQEIPTPVFLSGESCSQRSLVGYSP